MGTSSMYTGPSKNPLLPSDFDDNNNSSPPDQEQNEGGSLNPKKDDKIVDSNDEGQRIPSSEKVWQRAKNAMSRYASGNSSNFKGAISRHIKAYGGAKYASRSAKSGIRITAKVGRFLSSASTEGIREALKQSKIAFEGRTAKDILNEVINLLAPGGVTKEDAVARKSLIRAMEVLYEKLDDENNDITTLEKIDKELLNELVPIQIESYIYERIINDLGSRIETKATTPAEAISKEKEIKEYINSKVEITLKEMDFSQINFNAPNIEKVMEGLFNQCYKVMEDML